MRISTLLRVGNFIGVKILYVTPSWNRMVELVAKSGSAARIAGVSSFPGECGTVNVFQAPTSCTVATKEQSLAKFRLKGDIGEHKAGLGFCRLHSACNHSLFLIPWSSMMNKCDWRHSGRVGRMDKRTNVGVVTER